MATEQEPAEVLAKVESIASSLSATQEALADCLDVAVSRRNASHRDASLPHPALRAVAEVALLLDTSRTRLIEAVKTIPAKAEYAPFAARLRDAAALHADIDLIVRQAPRDLAAPLSESVPVLMQIAADLMRGRDRLLEAGVGLRVVTQPLPAETGPAAPAPAPNPVPAPPHVMPTPIVLPAQLDPVALKALGEVATAIPSLAEAVRQLGELSSHLRKTGEQMAPAVAATPTADDWERTLAPLREMSFVAPALEAVLERMESLESKLATQMAHAAAASAAVEELPVAGTLGHEADAVTASLRGVQDIAGPLVDSLSDLAHLTGPLAEKLRALAEAPIPPAAAPLVAAAPVPAPAEPPPGVRASASSMDGMAEWANDILRAVKDLKNAISHAPRTGGEPERRLWESVRRLQTEIVNLQGTLLSPSKAALPDDSKL